MKIRNFKLKKVTGSSVLNYKFFATVDCTTGRIFKKTVTREIFKTYVGFWYFSDTGQYTPELCVERLSRSLEATHGQDLQHCPTLTVATSEK